MASKCCSLQALLLYLVPAPGVRVAIWGESDQPQMTSLDVPGLRPASCVLCLHVCMLVYMKVAIYPCGH